MIVTDDTRPTSPCPPMGRDQDGRIEFESTGPILRDIGGRLHIIDQIILPKQQPAHFLVRISISMIEDLIEHDP